MLLNKNEQSTYGLILGRQSDLAAAEALTTLGRSPDTTQGFELLTAHPQVLLFNISSSFGISELFFSLGGSIKLFQAKFSLEIQEKNEVLVQNMIQMVLEATQNRTKKLFGISYYGGGDYSIYDSLPSMIKSELSRLGDSSRYISPANRKTELSSAQVEKTGLKEQGIEIIVFIDKDRIVIGKTLEVQKFEDFGSRDYDKPNRSIERGILSPKVARMMLNLAQSSPGKKILDPFCGNGVLCCEGALMGYDMTGSDIEKEAIQASVENMEWLKKQRSGVRESRFQRGDVKQVARQFGPFSFDAVVGEGDLGPNFSKIPSKKIISGLAKTYRKFYISALSELRSVVQPGNRVVLATPRWNLQGGESMGLELSSSIRLMGYRRCNPFDMFKEQIPKEWQKRPLVYSRPGQKTTRQIWILEA